LEVKGNMHNLEYLSPVAAPAAQSDSDYWVFMMLMILIMMLFCTLFVCLMIFLFQRKYKKQLVERVPVTMYRNDAEEEKILLDKDPGDSGKLYEMVPDKREGELRKMEYHIKPWKQMWCWWPPGRPRIVQAHVPTWSFVEGNPEPWDPYDRPLAIHSEVLANLQNVNFSRAMVGRS